MRLLQALKTGYGQVNRGTSWASTPSSACTVDRSLYSPGTRVDPTSIRPYWGIR